MMQHQTAESRARMGTKWKALMEAALKKAAAAQTEKERAFHLNNASRFAHLADRLGC